MKKKSPQKPMSTIRLLIKLNSVTIDLKKLAASIESLAKDIVHADKHGTTKT